MADSLPIYPNITVQFTGADGNAYNLLGLVRKALIENDVPAGDIANFMMDATSGNYDHLIQVCFGWVNIE